MIELYTPGFFRVKVFKRPKALVSVITNMYINVELPRKVTDARRGGVNL